MQKNGVRIVHSDITPLCTAKFSKVFSLSKTSFYTNLIENTKTNYIQEHDDHDPEEQEDTGEVDPNDVDADADAALLAVGGGGDEEAVVGDVDPDSPSRKNKKKRDSNALRKAPQAPKRFKSSYICFFMAKQPEIKEFLGDKATVTEISKRSAEMWYVQSVCHVCC